MTWICGQVPVDLHEKNDCFFVSMLMDVEATIIVFFPFYFLLCSYRKRALNLHHTKINVTCDYSKVEILDMIVMELNAYKKYN